MSEELIVAEYTPTAREMLPDPPTVNQAPAKAPSFTVSQINLDDYPDESEPLQVIETRGGEHALSSVIKPSKGCISEDENRERMAWALGLNLPSVAVLRHAYLGQKVIICGGGSSLTHTVADIKEQLALEKRPLVLAVNKTHDWLINEHGITPDFAVLMDPREHIPDYMTPTAGVKYLFAGSLDPRAFEKFKDAEVYLWHPIGTAGDEPYLRNVIKTKHPLKTVALLPGPSTVGLRSVYLAMDILGFTAIELHGFDSCYDPDTNKLWPYEKRISFEHARINFTVFDKARGHKFVCTSNADMARQVYEFDRMIELLIGSVKAGKRAYLPNITVAGDGAIPWMAWKNNGHATPDRMAVKYQGSVSYDYQANHEALIEEQTQVLLRSLQERVPGAFGEITFQAAPAVPLNQLTGEIA